MRIPRSVRLISVLRPPVTGALAVAVLAATAPGAPAAQSFRTRPDLTPPEVRVTESRPGLAPGFVFVAPKGGDEQRGPMIYDDRGNLVWFSPVPKGTTVLDFKRQTYRGKPVLTWWEGKARRGYGEGVARIVDEHYRPVATVAAGRGEKSDFHETTLTERGTALIVAYKMVRQDLSSVAGGTTDDLAMQNVVQEVDVATGEVLFEWNANDHIRPTESYDTPPKRLRFPYDYIHLNSIDVDDDGNLLISARATHTVYKVDRRSGRIIWRLGGKRTDFRMGRGAQVRFQHDARRQPDGTITILDNDADEPTPGRRTRGVVLRVDERRMRATLLRQYVNADHRLSAAEANMQTLPNGDVFLGWGATATNVSEFTRSGERLFDAAFVNPETDSYRGFRFPWAGRPTTRPDAAADRDDDALTVHASWNGATDVASWRVLGGRDAGSLRARATRPRNGFETTVVAAGGAQDAVAAVEALDADGRVLSRSAVVTVGEPSSRTGWWIGGGVLVLLVAVATGTIVVRRRRA